MANIGGLATFKDRISIVPDVIRSISRQIDLLWIYCNDRESYDALIELPVNVKKIYGPDVTDRGKFYPCQFYEGSDNVYFTFDDDLIYPANYIEETLKGLNRHPGALVSHHGKKLIKRGAKSYYARLDGDQMRLDYRVLDETKGDHEIDIIGTGCMAFRLLEFCPIGLTQDMMADVEVSCMTEGKIPRYALSHPNNWVTYHPAMRGKWTVWDHFQKNSDQVQTEWVNNHFK